MAMPRGGRPLVTVNWIPASRKRETASTARFVSTFSCVTRGPSTSAITILIGFAALSFFDAIVNPALRIPLAGRAEAPALQIHSHSSWPLLLVIPPQTAVYEKCCSRDVVGFVEGQETCQT